MLSEDADRDLDAIWAYIAEDSMDAADLWIGRLFKAFDLIATTPGIGHKRSDLTRYPVLFWPVSAYLIIYRAVAERVEIVAVTQGSRDILRSSNTASSSRSQVPEMEHSFSSHASVRTISLSNPLKWCTLKSI